IAQLFSRRKRSGRAVASEENEDSIFLLDPGRIRHLISNRPHDSFTCRVFVQQLDYVALLEPVLTGQRLFNGVRVINAITQLRPVLVIVDPYDYSPALTVVAPLDLIRGGGLIGLRGRAAGSRVGLYGRRRRNKLVPVRYQKSVALFTEL